MHGRNQIDIQSSLFLKFEKDLSQHRVVEFSPLMEPAQLVILTEKAFEIASCEEGRSRSGRTAAQNGLFTEMENGVRKRGMAAGSAESPLTGSSIGQALMGTESALDFVDR